MKLIITIVAITLFGLLPTTFVHGQTSPKPAAGGKQAATAGAGKRTDVYHVHFAKAALGKAAQLGDWLKTPDPSNPMPDHFIVLRHQDGDAWITWLLRISDQKHPSKLRERLCLRTNVIWARGTLTHL
jgi:hypothetical protein